MKEEACYIQLTKGEFAIVDYDDFQYLSEFNWCLDNRGYAVRRRSRKLGACPILMHRAIMNPPNHRVVDHINGNKLDNRRSNLRICTSQVNAWNRHNLAKNNTSGHTGVFWNPANRNWRAVIVVNGKSIYLGSHILLDNAVEEREKALNFYVKRTT